MTRRAITGWKSSTYDLLIGLQARRPKCRTGLLNESIRRRRDRVERVLQAEPLPLVLTHLVKRQYVDAFDVPEIGRERGDLRDVLLVVTHPGHQHETQPDRVF